MFLLMDDAMLGTIVAAEERILTAYANTLDVYKAMLRRYGATTEVILSWKNAVDNKLYDERPNVSDGYMTFVTCRIRNANGAIVESDDHDLYMDFAWPIAIYHAGKERNEIEILTDIDEDLYSEMESCLCFFKDRY